jgi:hypothetical protein
VEAAWHRSTVATRDVSYADGRFTLNSTDPADKDAILYLTAKGGQPKTSAQDGDNPAIACRRRSYVGLIGGVSNGGDILNQLEGDAAKLSGFAVGGNDVLIGGSNNGSSVNINNFLDGDAADTIN